MAYIPPHKRHSKETERPLPTPELLAPQFKKNLNVWPSKSNVERTGNIYPYNHSILILNGMDTDDENKLPSSVILEPVSLGTFERKTGEKPLALVNTNRDNGAEVKWTLPKEPWAFIADDVVEDLLSALEGVRNEMKCPQLEVSKPTLIARVGKILYHSNPSADMESIKGNLTTEILSQWKPTFYTEVPVSYKENILKEVVPKIGVDFEGKKDMYQVKLSDSSRPGSTLFCKCRVMKEDGKLQLYKARFYFMSTELGEKCIDFRLSDISHNVGINYWRDMVIDIACLDKNLDLRLMLCRKRFVTDLTDDDMQNIRDLVSRAVVDPDVKGGLRWPLGQDSSGDKYKVFGVWHMIVNTYKNPSLRLKVRQADRFDFWTSTGQAGWEIKLILRKVVAKLQEEKVEVSSVSEVLKEDMRSIWDNFLCCEPFLT